MIPNNRVITIHHPLVKVGCVLGEGPLYDPETHKLHFVDIGQKRVYHLDIKTLHLSYEQFEEPITCLTKRGDGRGLACTAAQGFALLEGDAKLTYLHKPIPPEYAGHTRFNDGACDSKGQFFAGTLYSAEHGVPGQLYRFDPQSGECTIADPGPFTDSNGLGWSPNEKTFYFTDSMRNKIYAYNYQDGKLSNRRVYVDGIALGFPDNTYPDGLCIDQDGGVWSARWGGSRIIRFNEAGEIDMEVIFPTALHVTSCCFGGANNDQLYVTTAHCGANGEDASRQSDYPDSGHLFVVDLAGQFKGSRRHVFGG